MFGSTITAINYVVPPGKITNEDLVRRFGEKAVSSATKMAGIDCRRVVTPGICASDLAFQAADRMLTERNIKRESIDFVIFMSETPDYMAPATACVLQNRLGLSSNCGAFDVNLGCSAFPYGLSISHGLIASGIARRVLLLVADALTPMIHPEDRALVALHGDGGAAALIDSCSPEYGYIGLIHGTDGSSYQHLIVPASGARHPKSAETKIEIRDQSGCVTTQEHFHMNGPAVFHFVVSNIPKAILGGLDRGRMSMDDIDLFLFHQANKGMIDFVYKALKVPEEKRFYFVKDIGNCGAAATPIVTAEAWRQGAIKPGTKTLLASFGVGISWAVGVIKWPPNANATISASSEYQV